MPTFEKSRAGYEALFARMTITREGAVNAAARKIIAMRLFYEDAEKACGAPWWFIGALHMRECNNNPHGCLTNGELIIGTGRKTRLETKGRGPFATFAASAVDCAKLENWGAVQEWSVARCLYEAEKFNGWGYIGKANSPYVWAGSSEYCDADSACGKYVSDGVYSSRANDPQLGIAPVIKRVLEITGAKRIPKGESKSEWVAKWGKFTGLGGAGLGGIIQQYYQYATDPKVLGVALLVAAGAGGTFWWIERKKIKQYREGRYIPSGEASHLDDSIFRPAPKPKKKAKK